MLAKNKDKPTTKECTYILETAHRQMHVKMRATERDHWQ